MAPAGYQQEDIDKQVEMGNRIRERREALGFKNPADLARKINDPRISSDYIGAIERAASGVRYTAIVKIAKALGWTSSHIIGDAAERTVSVDAQREYDHGFNHAIREVQGKVAEVMAERKAEKNGSHDHTLVGV